jgi:glutathione reductase (NADPH)
MPKKFDLVVIGTGSAATTAAFKCRTAGWSVAVVDSRPFGGTCALRGCDPKKVLVGAATLIDWVRRMDGKGIRRSSARIEWPELMRFKRAFTEPVPKQREESFTKAGINTFHSVAHFTGPTSLQVGEEVIESRDFLVAGGAKPQKLSIQGEQYLTTSEQFLELDSFPRRIVFVGGGYISFEFAHISLRCGADVTIVHRAERPLERFDPDLVGQLVKKTRQLGADVQLRTEVQAIEKRNDALLVSASDKAGNRDFEADIVVHGAGRVADIDDLNLAAAGVESEKRGVKVNEYLQSISNPAVYAAGDSAASGLPPLTPVAAYEGEIAASNMLKGNHRKVGHVPVPSVVFTVPPLAAVGLSERAAQQQGLRFRVHREETGSWYSNRRVAEDCSGFKVLIEEETDRLLGAHLLGPEVDELINIFAMTMQSGISLESLRNSIFAYPTHGSDLAYML